MQSQSGRTSIENVIMAAVFVLTASLMQEIKCRAPSVGSLGKAMAA